MNDIQFVEVNPQKIIADIISDVEKEMGETLYPGDERRILTQQFGQVIVALKNNINDTGKQNLVRYARDENLDALGELNKVKRLPAEKAKAPFKFVLSEIQSMDIRIPKGTRVSPDGILVFETIADAVVLKGNKEVETIIQASQPGSRYNNFDVGQIKIIIDPNPYVQSGFNTGISFNGTDLESNERYRERMNLAPESYSIAGPRGAYEYFALAAHGSIVSVNVRMVSPGTVKITALCEGGAIPTQSILDKVNAACNSRTVRPLTDNVQVSAPTVKTYNIDLVYYIDSQYSAFESKYKADVEQAVQRYIKWQMATLGKDVSPDELRYEIQNAAVYEEMNGKIHTVVRKLDITAPLNITVADNEVAKVGTVSVVFGGFI